MSIKKQILKGSIYTGGAKYFNLFINLLVTSILARILAPSDFGLIALTTVVMSFFDIIATAGLGPAIIQSKRLKNRDYADVFSWSIIIALVCFLLFNLAVIPISHYYQEERLVLILRLLSIQLLFTSFNVFPYSLMLKHQRFKDLSILSSFNTLFFGIMAVVMAYSNMGIFSLLAIPIGNAVMTFLVCIILTRGNLCLTIKPKFVPIKGLMNFSVYQFSFNMINYFSRNLDKLLLGKYLGMGSLGYYEKSYRLMTLPISTLTNVFAPTIQPVLANYQDDKSIIRNTYNSLSRYLLSMGAIITPFFVFSAREIIYIIFGPQWGDAVPIFQILAFSVIFQLVDSLSGGILQSSNNVKYLFVSGFICALVNIAFLVMGLFVWGDVISVSICVSVAYVLNFFISTYYINKYAVTQNLLKFYSLLKIPLLLILIVSIALFGADSLNLHYIVSVILKFMLTIIVSYVVIKKTGYIQLSSKMFS